MPKYDYTMEPDPRNKELILGVGDTISINVWEQRDLNTESTIRPDGTITMPLVGDLKAAGETPSALKAVIKTKLTDFVKLQQGNDLVTVAVRNWRSYRFTIQGEVTRQGVFTSDHFVTVADAIAMAGGLTRFAKRQQVKLFRTDPKSKQVRAIPLDYDALSSGKRLDMNIWVLGDDVIYVP
jgi:polysaccharide export outer membrane protein